MYDFLRDIVSRVPDLGGSEGAGDGTAHRKRFLLGGFSVTSILGCFETSRLSLS